jgi:magnesium chelatase family protein
MRIAAPLNTEADPALQFVEVATSLQLPSFHIIGLPSPEVSEARERVRAAIEASELEFPRRRVVLNLSPASVKKRGTGLDLAMALAILAERDPPGPESVANSVAAWGELGLDGTLKPAAQLTRALYACWEAGIERLFLARAELAAALERLAWIRESGELAGAPPALVPADSLREAWRLLESREGAVELPEAVTVPRLPAAPAGVLLPLPPSTERAVAVASAGSHHLLLLGPRGTGKSHALEWRVALQPPAAARESLRQVLLAELQGNVGVRLERTPVRRVSSHARAQALLGGAISGVLRPGEFTLAHGGLLVADELPEWSRDCREALREPLERGLVTLTRAALSRAGQGVELPACFTLAANGNLCACGGWPTRFPSPSEGAKPPRCRCSPVLRESYLGRLSGPILDRLDLVVLSSAPGPRSRRASPASLDRLGLLRETVSRARARAESRWGAPPGRLPAGKLEELLRSEERWRGWLDDRGNASLRSRHKSLRVALTLSAWDGADAPTEAHFAEAACYRPERYGLCD